METAYGIEIDTLEVMEDHAPLFLSAPPRYAPVRIVQILNTLSPATCLPGSPSGAGGYGVANGGKMAMLSALWGRR